MRRLLVASAIMCSCALPFACSDYGSEPNGESDGGADAAVDDDVVPVDGTAEAGDAARCDPDAAFGTPVVVPGPINSADDETYVGLSSDELVIFIARGVTTGRDLFYATRPSPDALFGAPQPVTELNSPAADDGLTISRDGLLVVFHSTRVDAAAPADLYFATRQSLLLSFGPPQPITVLNSPQADIDAYLLPDKSVLYFASNRSGPHAIHRATISPLGGTTFSDPTKLPELGPDAATVGAPVVTQDETEIFITSNAASARLRVFRALRSSRDMPFGAPTEVTELNTPTSETLPSWLSADRCVLYLVSDRLGSRDVFVATRGK